MFRVDNIVPHDFVIKPIAGVAIWLMGPLKLILFNWLTFLAYLRGGGVPWHCWLLGVVSRPLIGFCFRSQHNKCVWGILHLILFPYKGIASEQLYVIDSDQYRRWIKNYSLFSYMPLVHLGYHPHGWSIKTGANICRTLSLRPPASLKSSFSTTIVLLKTRTMMMMMMMMMMTAIRLFE